MGYINRLGSKMSHISMERKLTAEARKQQRWNQRLVQVPSPPLGTKPHVQIIDAWENK